MAKDLVPVHAPVSSGLHPMIYVAIIGLTLWLIFWAWLGFAGNGYNEFLLAVVSGFFLMVTIIPFAIWRMWRRYSTDAARAAREKPESLRDWTTHEFNMQSGPVTGREAAVEVLLPIAAVAFGMMAFAIVLIATWHHIV